MGTVAYKPLTEAEKIFKDLIWDNLIRTGEAALEGAVPFLNLPVIKQADEEILSLLSDYLFNQFVLFTDVSAIRLVNKLQQTAYETSSLKLKVILAEHGANSPEFMEARDEAKLQLSRLAHFGN